MYPARRYRAVPGDSPLSRGFPFPARTLPVERRSRFFSIDREIARRIRSTPLPATGGHRPKTTFLVTNWFRTSRLALARRATRFREAQRIKTILTMTAIYRHCSNARAHYAVIIVNYYLKFPRRRLVLRESICLPLASSCVAGIFLLSFSIPRITAATRSALITARYERHSRGASLRGHVTDPFAKIFAAFSAFFNHAPCAGIRCCDVLLISLSLSFACVMHLCIAFCIFVSLYIYDFLFLVFCI